MSIVVEECPKCGWPHLFVDWLDRRKLWAVMGPSCTRKHPKGEHTHVACVCGWSEIREVSA